MRVKNRKGWVGPEFASKLAGEVNKTGMIEIHESTLRRMTPKLGYYGAMRALKEAQDSRREKSSEPSH